MLLKPLASSLILVAVLLAGCSGGGGAERDFEEEVPELEVTSSTGGIRGVVVDATIVPIKGAAIVVQGSDKTTESDANGLFTVSGLEAGTYLVSASHPLYDQVQQSVEVVAGVADPSVVKFQLTRVIFAEPYLQTLKYDGFIVCSTNVGTPEVGYLLSEECGEGVGVPCEVPPPVGCTRQGGQGNNAAQYDFTVSVGAKTVIIEQIWEPTSEAGTGFYSPVSTEWSCLPVCSGNRMITLQGESPLRGVLNETDLQDAEIVPDSTNISVFTWAQPGDTPVSVLLNQQFQTFVTIFYYLPAPEGWSFVNGDPNPFA